jgi:carotenoid cleavage dioxygenase
MHRHVSCREVPPHHRGRQIRLVGDGRLLSEAVSVPAAGASPEDERYLLTVVSDPHADASRLLVPDAPNVKAAPIAMVHLPCRGHRGHPRSLAADLA